MRYFSFCLTFLVSLLPVVKEIYRCAVNNVLELNIEVFNGGN
jgi:hypothetical protein